jgi:hypothetical protein
MVLEKICRGRLVLVIGGQESQNYSKRVIRLESTMTSFPVAAQGVYSLKLMPWGTTRLEATQIRWFS